MSFNFTHMEIPDVILIEIKNFPDQRGFFEETFRQSDFSKHGIEMNFSQDNHSFSRKGVVRGLHFQMAPHEQGKLVYTVCGKIFDVAVDIRPASRTFGKHVSAELSDENHRMLWIPPGFAHGFMAIEDSHVIYKTTKEYAPGSDSGIIWNDGDIGIRWPAISPIVSENDLKLRSFAQYRENIRGEK
ncbi:MAG: dTDP-4-dehydrorhamnose 3,5-epimerase [Thermoplasmata archaeon]